MKNPFTIPIDVRFRDIDAMGHVNNAVYASYMEQARARYYQEVINEKLDEVDTVLARIEIDYHNPIDLGEDVSVKMRTTDIGNSSLIMEYEIVAAGEVAASGKTVQVVFDRATGRSTSIPDAWRERIERDRERRT
jgi:acyl-CoA thioester hydrolase